MIDERPHGGDGSRAVGCAAGRGATVRPWPAARPSVIVSTPTARRWCSTPPRRATLLALTGGLEAATVSACPQCRSRILAVVALVDLLADAPPFAVPASWSSSPTTRRRCTSTCATSAPRCTHRAWRDPGAEEWSEVMAELAGPSIVR